MLFNSLEFLIFFPIVVAAYFALSHKYRWILLLVASYYFYMCWNYKYVVLLLFTTIICYICAIWIHKTSKIYLKKLLLLFTLFVYLGTLVFFKYFNFLGESINVMFQKFNIFYNVPAYHYLLPVGISFYTFQALSYTIDVYRGTIKPEYHFGRFALFKSFFPQLVAGPIERATHLLPQFSLEHKFKYENIRDGLALMLWGYFKKVVIADRLAEYVNVVYNNPSDYYGTHLIIATLFFTFQIYCDFSGYSDIAVGTARMMDIHLMTNFRRPYFSPNIKEFWQRWHISLSTWFKDYLYIPLGGNRVVKWRMHYNLIITFVVSGLWHGANWTFVIWGGLHGFYLVFAIISRNFREKVNARLGIKNMPELNRQIQIGITFILVVFAWIFFRANNLNDALLVIKNIFVFDSTLPINLYRIPSNFYLAIGGIIVLLFLESREERVSISDKLFASSKMVKWAVMLIFIATILVLGVWEGVDFLYFQF